jgi:hypothetical protein
MRLVKTTYTREGRPTLQTQCSSAQLHFQELGPRKVIADFRGGTLTSDSGALLLRQVDLAKRYVQDFATCFHDERDPRYVEHSLPQLLRQRVLALCLGYEDLNDHDRLRQDPLFATACGVLDPTGSGRKYGRDRGKPLAGKSTLNRLETTPPGTIRPRAKKIVYDAKAIESYFVQKFLQSRRSAPRRLVLDLDCTDTILHGHQQGRFFHGYYDCYCYLPLYVFCGSNLLVALLRPSNIDPAEGALEEIQRLVQQLRAKWPRVQILIRGDSGFCREAIMSWCEANSVDYLFGLARNSRLHRRISKELAQAREAFQLTRQPQRVYKDLRYRTQHSWSRSRRVIGKAEYLAKGENPRFVVTSLPLEFIGAQALYEQLYCARGEMENRIKEQQLYLFASRTSSATMRANQLRLWFSALAYLILNELRKVGLRGTQFVRAQCDTIRLKLLKIGALVSVSVRRVHVRLASGYPYQEAFQEILANLQRSLPVRC